MYKNRHCRCPPLPTKIHCHDYRPPISAKSSSPLAFPSVLDFPTSARTTISSSADKHPLVEAPLPPSPKTHFHHCAIFRRYPSMSDSDLLLRLLLHRKGKTMGGVNDFVDAGDSDTCTDGEVVVHHAAGLPVGHGFSNWHSYYDLQLRRQKSSLVPPAKTHQSGGRTTASITGGRKLIFAPAIFRRHSSMPDSDLLLHLLLHCKKKTMGGDDDSINMGDSMSRKAWNRRR
ncbi:hypothetical protein ACLOJK_017784 [Asimina triloba]